MTTWVGGGSPRFWFSVSPQPKQLNYAQVLVQLTNKDLTPDFVTQVQPVLTAKVPGVRCDYRQLQTNPINYPVEIRVVSQADVGSNPSAARRTSPSCAGSHRRWKRLCAPLPRLAVCAMSGRRKASRSQLQVNPDRANLAGITNLDVANSATSALSGTHRHDACRTAIKNIPVVARLKMNERARLSDIQNLYVYSSIIERQHQDSAGADLRHR